MVPPPGTSCTRGHWPSTGAAGLAPAAAGFAPAVAGFGAAACPDVGGLAVAGCPDVAGFGGTGLSGCRGLGGGHGVQVIERDPSDASMPTYLIVEGDTARVVQASADDLAKAAVGQMP